MWHGSREPVVVSLHVNSAKKYATTDSTTVAIASGTG